MRYKAPKVWFWRPSLYWHGLATLLPFGLGGDEFGRRTLLLGWTVTGRIIVPISRQGSAYEPDHDFLREFGYPTV